MKNKKGFTLIELLGVFVIIGLILMVVMPNIYRLINSTKEEKYKNYYDIVMEAAEEYATDNRSDLGSSMDVGCTKTTLNDLIKYEYVTEFTDDDIKCTSSDIYIDNNKGNIKISYKLEFKKGSDKVYEIGTAKTGACVAYTRNANRTLQEAIVAAGLTGTNVDGITYINSASAKNYVYYSGHYWRIVSYNKNLNTVKAVTDDPVVTIPYDSSGGTKYAGSNIQTWLSNDFATSLSSNFTSLISNTTWYPSSNSPVKARIGLITKAEYERVKNWYSNDGSWLLDEDTTKTTAGNASSSSYHMVRPAITFGVNNFNYNDSADGSASNPFIVLDNAQTYGKSGDLLITRNPGEYVKLNNKTYRIVSINSNGVKIIGMPESGNKNFSVESTEEGSLYYLYDATTLGIYNNNMTFGTQDSYLTNGDFCMDTIDTTTNVGYVVNVKCQDPTLVKSMKVGLPKIGELFTTKYGGVEYWTINPAKVEINSDGLYTNSTINTIKTDGTIGTARITEAKADVIELYLDPAVKVSGGKGISSNPFTLQK